MRAIFRSSIVWGALGVLIGCDEANHTPMDSASPTATPTVLPTATPTATATATPGLPDLVPLGVREVGCGVFVFEDTECLYLILEVCAENAGEASAGESTARVDGRDLPVPALAAGETYCDRIDYRFGSAVMTVDVLDEIPEADEANNILTYPQPNGTRCDTCMERRTPTPAPRPSS